jgi:glycosyltransferase involved in cell wall biosynthesis
MRDAAVERASGASPRVSVIIPVLDDAPRLAKCLAALERQTFPSPFEVLVVDNGSTDDPDATVQRYQSARLLRQPRPSSYAARNLGVAEAQGNVLAFTDADCVPAHDWLERGCDRIAQAHGRIFVGGPVDLFALHPERPTAAELYEAVHSFPQRHFIEVLSFSVTANLFVRKDVFESVGEFSGSMMSSGDREWGLRAHKAGVRPVYADDVRVAHPCRRTFAELNRQKRRLYDGDNQFRALRGEPSRTLDLRRLARPPIRSTVRNLRRVDPPTVRSKVMYAGGATLIYYIDAFQRARAALRESRSAGSGHPRGGA